MENAEFSWPNSVMEWCFEILFIHSAPVSHRLTECQRVRSPREIGILGSLLWEGHNGENQVTTLNVTLRERPGDLKGRKSMGRGAWTRHLISWAREIATCGERLEGGGLDHEEDRPS